MVFILKDKAINRILATSFLMLIVLSLYTLDMVDKRKISEDYKEVSAKDKSSVYALNKDGYLTKTSIYVNKSLSTTDKIKELLEVLIKENDKNVLLPSYFSPVLPLHTKVLSVKQDRDILKIDFSKEFSEVTEEQLNKMLEAITYTLTDLEKVNGIEIYVEGFLLKYVPNMESSSVVLTKDIGINKMYDIKSNNDISKVKLYYYHEAGGNLYFVPVTKYLNDKREKVEIIVENLANFIMDDSLISYLSSTVKLNDYEVKDEFMVLDFNEEILSNGEIDKLKINPILYSVFDNYDINKIIVKVNNNKILEKVRKDIEN